MSDHLGHMQHGVRLQDMGDGGPQLACHKSRGSPQRPVGTGCQLGWPHCQFKPTLPSQQGLQKGPKGSDLAFHNSAVLLDAAASQQTLDAPDHQYLPTREETSQRAESQQTLAANWAGPQTPSDPCVRSK